MTVGADKDYPSEATGPALETVNKHAADSDIVLFGSWFCPFVQRVWVAAEYLGISYKANEVDPYQKPKELVELSHKGLVPALRLNSFSPPRALNESTVIMDYLEDLASTTTKRSLFPPSTDAYARALVRLQADHISRTLVPAFYRYLQSQDQQAQIDHGKEFVDTLEHLASLFERAEREVGGTGMWKEGGELGYADAMVGPWIFRANNVLTHYRGFEMPQTPKFSAWVQRLLEHPAFRCTCSTDDIYVQAYLRYASNRPNTSQVANAINSGRALP
ncbi:glutathione S-transferase C-terminal-like protein [Coniophora puteana RWD-64-598 SS2]|uniref:Glutathione S-transferase C-terminal-like protein n=1 Tax=Coniophora puteana (strain RWD-64-598) TaxID=741705 RepID=A0A5M3MEN8_CONPW|nr:glutathione S-transferase C-terminal-like protein [Coniophora puteana RWD-64-598 SS2]EIW77264.1 glutathione S-transferase C-terminal-like protein [Coniophora puteana RWD-64-598 SS2]